MIISYELYGNLYLNITNKCTNNCSFCIRTTDNGVDKDLDLWLDHEPTYDEIISDLILRDMSCYREVVFCGYGEPLMRLDIVTQVARFLKMSYDVKIRINTNGQANKIYDRDITPDLIGLVDSISISLNAKNKEEYQKVCDSVYGEESFNAVLDFARCAKENIASTTFTVVDVLSQEDIAECAKIADQIGVSFRVRILEGNN